ncbi:MAG: transcription antitermination factor NusB [SAR202 cluster bacterium]|nr:transcription antitermination factor NusB [SAR202 cluster bacterium]
MDLRRRARVVSVQVLYETDRSRHDPIVVLERRLSDGILNLSSSDYSRLLINGILENREKIDKIVAEYATAWPINQIAAVDKNILRIAVFEIIFGGDVPYKVAINEAIELSKIYGTDSSPAFVNGVLGSLMDSSTLVSKA